MNLAVLIASAILLQPVLAETTEVRLAASDTAREEVTWYVDGAVVATTASGAATVVVLPAGTHDVWATTAFDGSWRAVARPVDGPGSGAVVVVDGWGGAHAPDAVVTPAAWPFLVVAAGLGVIMVGRLRPKRP